MELLLSDEQRLLQDSVAKHLAQAGGVRRTRELRGKPGGFDRTQHARMADEGWFGILVPQEHGGLGLGTLDMALVLIETGRVLAPEPVAATALAALTASSCADAGLRRELVEGILAGKAIIIPAFEAAGDGSVPAGGVVARGTGPEVALEGALGQVPHAAHCDGYFVEAKADGSPALYYVPRGASGVRLEVVQTVDGRDHARLVLEGARVRTLVADAGASGRLYDMALVLASAELVGVMSAALDMTVEYLKIRQQFGKPIGSFQALQHRAVEDLTSIVSTRSLLFQLCAQGGTIGPAMASALKAHASGEALKVTKSAIQMHGGIGFTDEHDIGLFLKRAMWLSAYLGNAAFHRRRYARASS